MYTIYLVGLPIGNNKDLTVRAKEILQSTSKILAEDTRVFRSFCVHNDIDLTGKFIDSFHEHTSDKKLDKLLNMVKESHVAIVSDAGSPVISDPAYPLIQFALEHDIQLQSIPGISAVTVALELSGLPPCPFHFHGFISRDKGKKDKFADLVNQSYGTHLFFEGVSRVEKTMDQMVKKMPEANFCIARELTKDYQQVLRFNAKQWSEVKKELVYKGEFVVLVHNNKDQMVQSSSEIKQLAQDIISQGNHPKKLSKLLALITGLSNKEIYKALQVKDN